MSKPPPSRTPASSTGKPNVGKTSNARPAAAAAQPTPAAVQLTVEQFWQLLIDSQVMSANEVTTLATALANNPKAAGLTAERACKLLVAKSKLSPYQSRILLSGRPGPFRYGDYQIHDRIESGRLAGIFRAIHVATRHPVCLYFLTGAEAQDPQRVAALAQLAAATHRASVGHPHLLRCYHLADEGAYRFIAIEDLQGRRVERLMATDGALPPDVACRIARQAALGLGRLHAMGLTYEELRPANIWLDINDTAKLMLFPLYRDPLGTPHAWLYKARRGQFTGGKVPVEADYIAPELINGDSAPDTRSDLYSLGCTLYHMLAGVPPFAGGTLAEKLARHRDQPPRPLVEVRADIPDGLSKLVNYLLAKDPDLRYQKAEGVVEALVAQMSPAAAQSQPLPPTRAARAYEAWLQAKLADVPAPAAAEVAAAEAAPVQAIAATSAPATTSQPMMPVMPQAVPVMSHPVPVAGMPMPGIPAAVAVPVGMDPAAMMAMPVTGYPSPMMTAGVMPVSPLTVSPMPAGPMFDAGPAVATAPSSSTTATRRRRKSNTGTYVFLGLLIVVGGAAAGLHFSGIFPLDKLLTSGKPAAPAAAVAARVEAPPPPIADEAEGGMDGNAAGGKSTAEKVAGLDVEIWPSPTRGQPLEFKYLPISVQAIAALRPAELLKHAEGKHLLAPEGSPQLEALAGGHPLGVVGSWVQRALPELLSIPLEQMEQVLIGWPNAVEDAGLLAIAVQLTEPADEAALVESWGKPAAQTAEDQTYYVRDKLAYYLPKDEAGRVVVVVPARDVKETLGTADVMIPVQQMETLLRKDSDRARQFTFACADNFFTLDGRAIFTGPGSRLKAPLDWLLTGAGDSGGGAPADMPKALLLSAHFTDEALFIEARLFNAEAGLQTQRSAEAVRDRLRQIPKLAKDYVLELLKTPYSLPLLKEFDDRVRAWQQSTRVGTADKQIVVRSYLPATAGLHLALGTHLCLLETPQSMAGVAVAASGGAGGGKPASGSAVADRLKKVTSLSFPRNTLEKSMEMLADDLGCPVTILGTDLQLDGITKNMSFGLEEKDKPAFEIFKVIFAKADPRLIYVIKKDDAGTETLFITTRNAAKKRGDAVPAELAAPEDTKKK